MVVVVEDIIVSQEFFLFGIGRSEIVDFTPVSWVCVLVRSIPRLSWFIIGGENSSVFSFELS